MTGQAALSLNGFTLKPKCGLITLVVAFNCASSFFVGTAFDFWASGGFLVLFSCP